MTQPSLFISHGSPMLAVQPGRLGALLQALGKDLPKPEAILVMSPHWMSRQLQVQATPRPQTVHDFGGFPRVLYELEYPAKGAPAVAAQALNLLRDAGVAAVLNDQVGYDHGTWVPLLHLYPEADVPVFQVSQPPVQDPRALFALGEMLAPLREQGVMVIGSGSMTHNLYEFRMGALPDDYAQNFADWVAAAVARDDLAALFDYRRQAPEAVRAHPTDEHFLPLFFALGAAGKARSQARRLVAGVSDGVISGDSFLFGE